ncbi:uncharacterized mitochondrial protein AtMg00810-like [Prosopis cineraria]|uniref:uncharacterized mitochondrial protein AtMg00810-like n=1 Tax=Prosopis cineraria TaxID=364024 RepID=UPI00240FDC44|nr:uncharacterized mitochondrial protein AtMg00810-like [Prosopis cineraria]
MVHTQYSKVIKIFHRDNGLEYRDSKLLTFLDSQDISTDLFPNDLSTDSSIELVSMTDAAPTPDMSTVTPIAPLAQQRKACLVTQGFTQEYGVNYEETFTPVVYMTSVRSLLAIATAPRAWFTKFSNTMNQLNFSCNPHDSALFIRSTAHGIILLLLYVDDMIITNSDDTGVYELKTYLGQQFDMKDLDGLNYFFGIEVHHESDGISVSQVKYAIDLISQAHLSDKEVETTPIELNVHYTSTDGTLLDNPTRYRQLVGSLIYLAVTQPDITYAIHVVSQFMSEPRTTHYAIVLQIIWYIKGTLYHGLYFSASSSLALRAYFDVD